MMRKILILSLMVFGFGVQSQTLEKTINSEKLGMEREFKIQLPRNYDANPEKHYPLIIVLDGEYMFDAMAGNVDLLSYWEEIPESIVVGINQKDTRMEDCFYEGQTFLPYSTGASFFEFLGMELLPYLDEHFRTAKFVAIAGHDFTANFINYYLLKEDPLFQAYMNFSPELAPEMADRLVEVFKKTEADRWFYLATSNMDAEPLRKSSLEFDKQLQTVENPYFHYNFDNFEATSHFSLIAEGIPRALHGIFSEYRPISVEEYQDHLITLETSPYEYLVEKYEKIEDRYGLDVPIRKNDFLAVGKALEHHQNWDDLEKLGNLARKEYPDSTLGIYYLARAYEAYGRPQKAMKAYRSAFGHEEVAFITIDFMLDKADLIKKDFGY